MGLWTLVPIWPEENCSSPRSGSLCDQCAGQRPQEVRFLAGTPSTGTEAPGAFQPGVRGAAR